MKSEAEIRANHGKQPVPRDRQCPRGGLPDDAGRDSAHARGAVTGNGYIVAAWRRAPGTRSIASLHPVAGCRPHPPAATESDGLERSVARRSIRQWNGGAANREIMRFLPILAFIFSLFCL